MSILPDPPTLRALATRIGLQAEAARSRATALDAAMATQSTQPWHGAAATAFSHVVRPVPGGLRTAATDLDHAAQALRNLAANVEAVLHDLAQLGLDVTTTGDDILTALRDGADPRTLITHPGTLVHDGIRLGKDGARLIGDGDDLAQDVGSGIAHGAEDGLKSLGSLVGVG